MSDDRDTIEKIALAWWSRLQPAPTKGLKGDTGTLARLRRGSLFSAAMEPETVVLYKRLSPLLNLKGEDALTRTALIAAVLAHVREHNSVAVARALGPQSSENDAVLKPLRFRRLISTLGDAELLVAFRRIVALLHKKANVSDIARSLADWDDSPQGDRRRTRWAFDYHNAGAAAPRDKSADAA
jgi:CRISPR system Cascade subunit CasB